MAAWGGESVRRARLRGAVAVAALIGLVFLMFVVIRASMDPGPPVGVSPRETAPPITVRLTVPVVPPLRVSPYSPE